MTTDNQAMVLERRAILDAVRSARRYRKAAMVFLRERHGDNAETVMAEFEAVFVKLETEGGTLGQHLVSGDTEQ